MPKRPLLFCLLVIPSVCLLGLLIYLLPPVQSRLGWRIANVFSEIRYALNPPEEAVFIPQGAGSATINSEGLYSAAAKATMESIVQATMAALLQISPTPPVSPILQEGHTPIPSPTTVEATKTATATPTALPTATQMPLPGEVNLTGFRFEYQKYNNCGPTNLSMALSYWGWEGDQTDTRRYLRPYFDKAADPKGDVNVNPQEMVQFVESQTELKALARAGGDPELLKSLLAAGFPVIAEKGYDPKNNNWIGHYVTFSGYDDARSRFITQDSYIAENLPIPYDELMPRWLDFNYQYIVIYPPDREAEVLAILGSQVDQAENLRYAIERARQDIDSLSGRDRFFAWYNLGSSLVGLEDWTNAAQAYDKAFQLYAKLPEKERPWRMLWYQAGPYAAYYYTGRYQDVLNLAETTLALVGTRTLEESLYWRGMAREATGDTQGAIADLQKAYELNPNSTPARQELERLGIEL